jgi:dihydroflavonol-4-reductase
MIFITGGNGLVGSFIIRQLLKKGHSIKALVRANSDLSLIHDILPQIELIEGDILDYPLLEETLAGVDKVVHAAAIVSFVPGHEQQMLKVNVEGTANVVNACLATGVKKLCYLSSVAALGRKKGQETIDEESKWESSDLNSNYARTKYLAELEVWRGIEEGLDAVMLNPSVILGPGDWEKSSVKLFKYIWNQNLFYVAGQVNYVDVRDVAAAADTLLHTEISRERFILNAGTISYKDLFYKIADNFGKRRPPLQIAPFLASLAWRVEKVRSFITGKAPIVTRETAIISQKSFFYDSSKIRNRTGFKFRELDDTISWTCEQLIRKIGLDNKQN